MEGGPFIYVLAKILISLSSVSTVGPPDLICCLLSVLI